MNYWGQTIKLNLPALVLHKCCVFTSCKLNLEILTFGFLGYKVIITVLNLE